MAHFQTISNAVLVYLDPVHGDLPWPIQFRAALKIADTAWLDIEMLSSSIQTTLDSLCTAHNSSIEPLNARLNLTTYFLHAWTPYFRLNITSEEGSPYFEAVDLIRQKKDPVYGLDLNGLNFILFVRYGESDFGAVVRSLHWAKSIPTKGRGITFGKSAHFTSAKPINKQDFLIGRDNITELLSIRFF